MRHIVAIIDNKSQEIVGNHLTLHRHVATAVRMYADIAADKNTMLHKHTEDFDLVVLATLDDDNNVVVKSEADAQVGHLEPEIILTGKAFAATQLTDEETQQIPLNLLREVK